MPRPRPRRLPARLPWMPLFVLFACSPDADPQSDGDPRPGADPPRDADPPSARTLAVGPNVIRYEAAGTGEAVVLLHGGGVDRHMWRPQIEGLSEDYRVVAYDLRGHGASAFEDNQRPDADDLRALLDELGIERSHVVGLSLGAIIALDFALAHPERTASLGLVSPGLVGVQEDDPSYLEAMIAIGRALEADDVAGAVAAIERATFLGRRAEPPEGLDSARAYLRGAARSHIARGYHTRAPALAEPAPTERLEEVTVPTLVVYGSADLPYVERNARVLAAGIPGARTVVIEGAGHMVNVERPEEVEAALRTFLEEVPPVER